MLRGSAHDHHPDRRRDRHHPERRGGTLETTILIDDDDPQILRALRITLGAKGYDVVTASDGAQAIAVAIEHKPDLYLLDLGMPQLDGIEVIHALRGWTAAPILVVSGRSGSTDKVEALDAGADDYVTKPFAIDELLARIRALSRRRGDADSAATASPAVSLGDVEINLSAKAVVRRGPGGAVEHIRLTPTEWAMPELLARNPGRLVTRHTLLTEIWGTKHVTDTGYLRLYVAQLRKEARSGPVVPPLPAHRIGHGIPPHTRRPDLSAPRSARVGADPTPLAEERTRSPRSLRRAPRAPDR